MEKTARIQGIIGFSYALFFVFVVAIVWIISGLGGEMILPLLIFLILASTPGFVGLFGKKIPFIFAMVVTVITTGLIMAMLLSADNELGVICISIIFLPLALAVSLIASIIAGIYLLIAKWVNSIKERKT